MYWHSQGRQLKTLRTLNIEPLAEMHKATAAQLGIKQNDYVWIETVRGKLRMKATLNEVTHEKVVTIPHGWWLPEAPGPDHGVFEVCSNVLVDDAIENCDVVLGSSPLKAMLCRVTKAEPPARTISQRWNDAQAAMTAAE
jgi:anaerobic selenocysteine-containing dehydrogenase